MGDFAKPVESKWSHTTLSASSHSFQASGFLFRPIFFLISYHRNIPQKTQQYYTGNVMK
jgi:hypothetical protein